MKHELNREYPEPDEEATFGHMVEITRKLMDIAHHKTPDQPMRRGQHAKATGCVIAEFRIADDVPADLRHGVFAVPGRTYQALVRFSNSQDVVKKDAEGTARGIAIELLDVAGERADAGDGDRTQDFLMVNHPVFPFPTPKAYMATMRLRAIPVVGEGLALGQLALLERDELKEVLAIRHELVASPLEITYWSGSPFWLGSATGGEGHAVKYSAVPRQAPTPLPEKLDGNYLTQALNRHLQAGEAVFDFKVQTQKDADTMPIEDVSMEWDEEESIPVTVVTLRIPPQTVDLKSEAAAKCEAMSFNPWHALAEHRPMGGMNRLRKFVYKASLAKRTGH